MGGFSTLGAAAAVLAALGTTFVSTGDAAVVVDNLLVRVYDNTGIPGPDRKRAYTLADEILARVDLAASWLECPAQKSGARQAACNIPPAPDEIMVRLVDASAQADRDYHGALGYSLIDSRTGRGTLATIFTNRVNALTQRAHADRAAVLGRTIAHEIGHLMLGSNDHTDSGLMRAFWTSRELMRNRPEDWHFTRAQAEDLRAARVNAAGGSRARVGGAGGGGQNPRTLLDPVR